MFLTALRAMPASWTFLLRCDAKLVTMTYDRYSAWFTRAQVVLHDGANAKAIGSKVKVGYSNAESTKSRGYPAADLGDITEPPGLLEG